MLDSPGIEAKDAVLSFSQLYSGVYAWSSYLGDVGGDDRSLLPSVVVIRPIFTKERMTILTLCLPLPVRRDPAQYSMLLRGRCQNWVVVIHP